MALDIDAQLANLDRIAGIFRRIKVLEPKVERLSGEIPDWIAGWAIVLNMVEKHGLPDDPPSLMYVMAFMVKTLEMVEAEVEAQP